MGAGITGSLIADELAKHGHDVIELDQRDVCWGRTSTSTALLQYENDTHAIDLANRYDQVSALLAYQFSLNASSEIGGIAQAVGEVDFENCESLYYASDRDDYYRLVDEFAWRKRSGFPVHWLNRAALKEEYGLTAPSAILSSVAARVAPYRLASRFLRRVQRQGAQVSIYGGDLHHDDRAFCTAYHR